MPSFRFPGQVLPVDMKEDRQIGPTTSTPNDTTPGQKPALNRVTEKRQGRTCTGLSGRDTGSRETGKNPDAIMIP